MAVWRPAIWRRSRSAWMRSFEEDYLRYRLAVSRYMAEGLNRVGIPTVQPPGGHAVYIDAKTLLPHIPSEQFPGQALACELFLAEGIRSCEIGSAMFGKQVGGRFQPAAMELVRLAFPRRVYTQSHFDYILEGMAELAGRRPTSAACGSPTSRRSCAT